jgi:hypothetical protein
MTIYIDCFGEYMGRTQIPYCYPEQIQMRIQAALEATPALDAVRARINFSDFWCPHGRTRHIFGSPNEINAFGLSQIARDPYVNLDHVWNEWATARYGKSAAEAVIQALRRSVHFVRKGMMFCGLHHTRHSYLAGFRHFDVLARHLVLELSGVNPDKVEEIAMFKTIAEAPHPYVLAEIHRSFDEADRLVSQSLADIEAAKGDLKDDDYRDLKTHFEFAACCFDLYRVTTGLNMLLRMAPEVRSRQHDTMVDKAFKGLQRHIDLAATDQADDSLIQLEALQAFLAEAKTFAAE